MAMHRRIFCDSQSPTIAKTKPYFYNDNVCRCICYNLVSKHLRAGVLKTTTLFRIRCEDSKYYPMLTVDIEDGKRVVITTSDYAFAPSELAGPRKW